MQISNWKFERWMVIFFILILLSNISKAQTEKTPLDTANLSQQFDYVNTKSSTYNDFKVVRISRLNQLWSNAMDSLKNVQRDLDGSRLVVIRQRDSITSLQDTLDSTEASLVQVTEEKDSIELLGIMLSKTSYHSIMWTIVILLIIMLGIAIYRFKESNKVTINAQKDLSATTNEFEAFKKRTLDKERKLMRELQTEINKVEDLKRKASH